LSFRERPDTSPSLLSQCSRRRDYLSQRDAAVVRRNALMPVRAKAFFSQPPDSAFGEVFVLKTSAGQNYFLFTHAPRDGDDAFNHRVVKLRRDFFGRDASTDIVDDAESHWQPVNDDGGLLITFTQIRGVGFIRIVVIERESQFHCALRFE